MNHDVIIALDFPSAKDVYSFLDKFQEEKPFVKIGMELFYAEGPEIVVEIEDGIQGEGRSGQRHDLFKGGQGFLYAFAQGRSQRSVQQPVAVAGVAAQQGFCFAVGQDDFPGGMTGTVVHGDGSSAQIEDLPVGERLDDGSLRPGADVLFRVIRIGFACPLPDQLSVSPAAG